MAKMSAAIDAKTKVKNEAKHRQRQGSEGSLYHKMKTGLRPGHQLPYIFLPKNQFKNRYSKYYLILWG